ncbi:formin-binding protein [Didymella glomerata]|uniref:Formin-binding protein n=1 Tax=Didymella glomerata TaxID=749621 RepID=A0A9W8WS79_9PLEO|nr:formin-binding protein [Didymella glomerata]
MPGTPTSEVPSVTLSFANNFWGKDDAGVGPLLDRMHFAKVTNDELKAFYAARAAIEEEYSKKLLQLSRKPLGSSETGTLRLSCDVIRAEVESMGKAHQSVAQQMHTELEEPLQAFAGGMKERRKIVQNGIEKLLKLKMQQTATVNKARDRYEQDCLKIKGFLAQAHMVMGHEERKNKARLEKTQINLSTTSAEYEAAVKVLEETTGRWNRDWKAACDKFQDLEEERIDYTKSSLWNFANIASTVCVSDDASCEKMRLSLEDCDVEKDITNFITESGTGQEIPDPPKFINFCRGDAETSSQVSDDENYSVAQFARTMNPSYRASSPPISVFESHHDPNNPLAKELGLQQDTQPIAVPQDQINVPSPRLPESQQQTPRPSTASRAVQPDPRLVQAQQQARQQYQQNPVPYNDYPADGMTQFCRPTALSDRNGAPSPMMRPQSRDDSHSDHSDLNSFSSVEPPSGSASPGKPMPQSFPEPSPIEENSFQKKRGFFNSPFGRRKSRPEIETPASVMPTSRNTWAPASRQATNENVSPTRPLGRTNRQPMVQDATRSASPEPVDPRANFQLNVGNNVFDVASPDKSKKQEQDKSPLDEIDPIAAALEELRGVTKQSTLRVSADKFAGLATPHPPATPSVGSKLPGGAPTPLTNVNVNAAKRGTPPPSYEQPPMSRLGAPKPAHTARQMQKTTEMYVNQKANVFNGNAGSRPATRGNSQQEVPRATSPAPNRAISPRPSVYTGQQRASQGQVPASPTTYRPAQRQQQQSPAPAANYNRSVSPNPYAASTTSGRPRAQTATAPAQAYGTPVGRNSYSSTRGASPAMRAPSPQPPQPAYAQSRPGSRAAPSSRAVSPQPAFRNMDDRPPSSHSAAARSMAGSERGDSSVYGGSIRGRPQSSYYGGGGGGSGSSVRAESRVRSKSLAEPKNYNRDGRIILNYSRAMYTYTAQIPEELTFSKGDILAVLRLQDDGWWEAEVVGKDGRPGLVPSNYLQPC